MEEAAVCVALQCAERKSPAIRVTLMSLVRLPNEHSSPIRWGLKQASLLWYDDLHQAQDKATISFELNDNFACNDCWGEKKSIKRDELVSAFVVNDLWRSENVVQEKKDRSRSWTARKIRAEKDVKVVS